MNTIFKKQFFLYACALIISFVLLGAGLTKAFTSFFINQKQSFLIEQAEKISKIYKQSLFFGGQSEKEINKVEKYFDCNFIILDYNNYVLVASKNIPNQLVGLKLEIDNQLLNLKKGEIIQSQGTLGGIFLEEMVIIGYPIFIGDINYGIIFVTSPVTDLLATVEKSYQIIILFIFLAIIIAFILVFIFSKKISLPLIEINKAAKIMADGNFEKRIYIDSKDEIGQLADVLNEMCIKLNEQEKRRCEFISNISHDIRSPLTSMRGFVQALLDGTIPDEKRERYLRIILEETERLTRLSNNILDINRLQSVSGENKYTKFDINDLIRSIILTFEARVTTKELKIKAFFEKEETFVIADIEKIERVIYNLIDNAIKFTQNNKNIFITTKIKLDKVFISIKDEGIGISEDMQKKVFERFYKVDTSRGKDKRGIGLGLSIVKEFILSHGETIVLNSEINKGSEFIFSLKIAD